MFENFSILFQSLKGVGEKCNFAPATDKVVDSTSVRFACDHALDSTYYLKSSLINCLGSLPRRWRKSFCFFVDTKNRFRRNLLNKYDLTPTVNVGKMLYLYSIIKKATKVIENLFCSLPDSTMVALPCCGQVGKNAVRLLFDFKLKQINNVY